MKRRTNQRSRSRLLACIAAFLMCLPAWAQPGPNCASALEFNPILNCENFQFDAGQSEMWHYFTATDTSHRIVTGTVQDSTVQLYNNTTTTIDELYLYSENCSSLTLMHSRKRSFGDDMRIDAHGLTPGSIYYVKMVTNNPYTSCRDCPPNLGKYELCVLAIPTQIPAPPCDLVCNGDFEAQLSCVDDISQMYRTACWNKYDSAGVWVEMFGSDAYPGWASADYFNSAFATDCPQAGNASLDVPNNSFGSAPSVNGGQGYAGFYAYFTPTIQDWTPQPNWWSNYREYVHQQLAQPILPGRTYRFSMWLQQSQASAAAAQIGVYFSDSVPVQNNMIVMTLPAQYTTPYVTNFNTGWTQYTYTFVGDSTCNYVTIGHFLPDTVTNFQNNNPGATLNNSSIISYYYIDQVAITPFDTLYASEDDTVCAGSPITLTASMGDNYGMIYQWTSSPVDSSLFAQTHDTIMVVSPTVPTDYFVEVLDIYGCVYHDTIHVEIKPQPIITLSGPGNKCGGNVTYTSTVNYTSNIVYNWSTVTGSSNSGTTGPSFTVDWNSSYTVDDYVILTVTDTVSGCSVTDSLHVFGCCYSSQGGSILIADTNSLQFFGTPSATLTTTAPIYINGTFIVNSSVTFALCPNVFMGPEAKIIVQANDTLFIRKQTHIRAGCNYMWDGIYLDADTSAFLFVDGSTIEDAYNAVVSKNGGRYYIRNNTKLNRHLRGIVVLPFNGTHRGLITQTTISCVNASNAGINLLAPHQNKRTQKGFDITGVKDITIGLAPPHPQSGVNTFDYMDVGIRAKESNVKVILNDFKRIVGGNAVAAVWAVSKVNPAPPPFVINQNNLQVGGATWLVRNTFTNCRYGVYADTNMNVSVSRNKFVSLREAIRVLRSRSFNTIQIAQDSIINAQLGIFCYDNSATINAQISGNYIQWTGPFASTGIRLTDLNTTSGVSYQVLNNQIVGTRIGIKGELNRKANIRNNYVTITPSNSVSSPGRGIEITGSANDILFSNNLRANPTTNTSSWNGGIYSALSPKTLFQCNDMRYFGYGLKCAGQMPSDIFNNSFRTPMVTGFWLSDNGLVGPQDNPYATPYTEPSYNKWIGTGFTYHTWTSNSTFGNLDTFYVRSFPTNLDPLINEEDATSIPIAKTYLNASSPLAPPCLVFPQTQASLMKNAQEIAVNQFGFAQAAEWNSKQALFHNLELDSINVSSNPVLQGFKNTNATGTLGKFLEVSRTITHPVQSVMPSMLMAAQGVNNSVAPANSSESNQKLVNDLILQQQQTGADFSPQQQDDLRQLANLCPFTEGIAVYQARALLSLYDTLGTIYLNPCEYDEITGSGLRLADTDSEENAGFAVYPNPAIDAVTVSYELKEGEAGTFEIYNLTGSKIASYILATDANEISINTGLLPSGVYLYRFTINGETRQADKMIIIK
jgi:hypothetical protein